MVEDAEGSRLYAEWWRTHPAGLAAAAEDPDRPRFHFLPEPGWMNDPVPIYALGAYHVFFQYQPGRPYWGNIAWGHACSADLVRWEQWPSALAPTPGGPDAGGCWTGSVVDDGGTFRALYTGVAPQVQCLASSSDLVRWDKYAGNPVIPVAQRPAGTGETFRDPCVWHEAGTWYMVLGADVPGGGGRPLLYRSLDLLRWQYVHPLCGGSVVRDECPDLFALGGRHVLLSSRDHAAWAVGSFSCLRFTPQRHGLLDAAALYAVKTLLDARGRRIAWGWVREQRPVADQVCAGWSGVLSLPRVLRILADGTVGAEPPEELAALRGALWEPRCPELAGTRPEQPASIPVPESGCFEVHAEFDVRAAGPVGVVVPGTEAMAWPGFAGGHGSLRVFVDRSVVEVFVDGRQTLTCRSYRAAGGGAHWMGFFGRGGVALSRLRVWDLGFAARDTTA